jgi:hypothetical protein
LVCLVAFIFAFSIKQSHVQIPTVPPASNVTLARLPNFYQHQLLHRAFHRVVGGLSDLMCIKMLRC